MAALLGTKLSGQALSGAGAWVHFVSVLQMGLVECWHLAYHTHTALLSLCCHSLGLACYSDFWIDIFSADISEKSQFGENHTEIRIVARYSQASLCLPCLLGSSFNYCPFQLTPSQQIKASWQPSAGLRNICLHLLFFLNIIAQNVCCDQYCHAILFACAAENR